MIPNLSGLYSGRWYKDILCLVDPYDFLRVATDLRDPTKSTIDALITAIKNDRPITIPSLWIDMKGVVTGHEGRHRSLACIACNVAVMTTIVHIDDRCVNFYPHSQYPQYPSMIRPEVQDINDLQPPEKARDTILEFQRTTMVGKPAYVTINKWGYGELDGSMLTKEDHSDCAF